MTEAGRFKQIQRSLESEEVGDQYTGVVSFCSNKATFVISVGDVAKLIVQPLTQMLSMIM